MADDLFLVYVLSFINYKLSSVLAKLRVNMQLFFANKMSGERIDTERHQYHFTSANFLTAYKVAASGRENSAEVCNGNESASWRQRVLESRANESASMAAVKSRNRI